MREELLHFIWRNRYYQPHRLYTEDGKTVEILFPGESNPNQGPDFQNARIRLDNILLEGAVELHIRTSDWFRHGHEGDRHYKRVVLHVVWTNDWDHAPPGGAPLLVLSGRTSGSLLPLYERWMKSQTFIPCEPQLEAVPAEIWPGWTRQLAIRRLQQRSIYIRDCLEDCELRWEEVCWRMMAWSMGVPVNGPAFEAIAGSLPLRLLMRYRHDRLQLEALLMGQAGLLDRSFGQDYPVALQREYVFLQKKHTLPPPLIPLSYSRMRPAHFPAIRLSQLAGLLSDGTGWFTRIKDAPDPRSLMDALVAEASPYWREHYIPDDAGTSLRHRRMGAGQRKGVVINAFIPVLFAYGWLRDDIRCREKALDWLELLAAEKNAMLDKWSKLGVKAVTARDSQALLELKKNYCNARRCLDCGIGRALLSG